MHYYGWYLAYQTYALNFIEFSGSQRLTPYLFLLQKLFCVAKLATLLVKLSSIFKLLPKSPLLSKSTLVFSSLLLLYTQGAQALSVYTSRAIEGSNLDHIEMIVPPSQRSVTINDLIALDNSVTFTDKNGNTVSRSDILNICNAPYRVKLERSGGTLETLYSVLRSSTFSGDAVDYYTNPNSYAGICSVRPNLLLGGTTGIISWDTSRFAGSPNIWSPDKGFLVQSTNPSSYGLNFPTTGSDGLYFDLDVRGVDASQLSWSVITSGDITATVSWTKPRSGTFTDPRGRTVQADEWIRDKSKKVTRVMLRGPRADRAQINSSNPSSLRVPSLPQTFELVARDSSNNVVATYGFEVRQWFVNRGNKRDTAPNQAAWCNRLGYRLSRVRDLTNAVCSGWGVNSSYPCTGAIGAMPSSKDNTYKRHIGAGFFTEWGAMYSYADAGFIYYYWTSDVAGSSQFNVLSYTGYVYSSSASNSNYAVCTTP